MTQEQRVVEKIRQLLIEENCVLVVSNQELLGTMKPPGKEGYGHYGTVIRILQADKDYTGIDFGAILHSE